MHQIVLKLPISWYQQKYVVQEVSSVSSVLDQHNSISKDEEKLCVCRGEREREREGVNRSERTIRVWVSLTVGRKK